MRGLNERNTTMKTKAKRYKHPNDIRDAIDRYRAKAQKFKDSAAALDMVADEFVKEGGHQNDICFNREQACKKRKAAGRIEERQLTKLKNKLSELMTDTMPSIITDGDKSIPVKG